MRRREALGALAAVAASPLASPRPARANGAWPDRPVKIVAPFAPGGSADTLGRLVATELSASLGQPFVVENRPGAGGTVGSLLVAKSPPDGLNLVISGIASHVIAPAINPNSGFDPVRDFTHIAYLGGPPIAMVLPRPARARNMDEFLSLARGPRPLSYASPGAGTHGHLIGLMLQAEARFRMEHIPYRGAGAAMADLLGRNVDLGMMTLPSAAAGLRQGQLQGLAVTTRARLPSFPDLPTFVELGFPNLVATTWFSLSGPAGLPPAIVERLNREVVRILALPAIRERLEADGIEAPAMGPAEFTDFIKAEIDRWGPLARASGAEAN